MPGAAERIESVADACFLAQRRLPSSLYDMTRGSATGATTEANIRAFGQVAFRPRAGQALPGVDLGVTVAGVDLAMPMIVAPTGNLRVFHKDGERGAARAAAGAGVAIGISSGTGTPIEAVAAEAPGRTFYQFYYQRDRPTAEYSIERAQAAGCRAVIVTLDSGGNVGPERDIATRAPSLLGLGPGLVSKLRYAPQLLTRLPWLLDALGETDLLDCPMGRTREGQAMDVIQAIGFMTEGQAPNPSWDDLPWIRRIWSGPLIVKGILSVEDARRAVEAGASGIVVSNHGGMLCDSLPPTLSVLPEIVDAVGSEVEVLFDSGVRRGQDVVKALALGAKAVLVGHAPLWALSAAGEAGVRRILQVFRGEIEQTMRTLGVASIRDLDRSLLLRQAT